MKPVTLKQIAETLGISVTTVSKALKDYPDVSKKTKTLVKDLASTLNYKPNSFAVNLRTSQSMTIGLIVPEIVHHFFSSVIKGIVAQAKKKGYLVIVLQSNESFDLEKKHIETLISKRVDGIIVSLANETAKYDHLEKVLANKTPLVLFDKIAKLVNCSKVVINDREAAYKATQHLIDTGCKKIAHFRGQLLPQNSIDRFLGYKKALLDNDIEFDSSLVYTLKDMTLEEGRFFAKQLIKDHKDVDGVFINTDLVAIGAIKEFREQNIKVPEDISIIGFSNWFMSSVVSPSLTTINQPGLDIGKKAFKLFYKEVKSKRKNKEVVFEEAVVETELIIRETTKPI